MRVGGFPGGIFVTGSEVDKGRRNYDVILNFTIVRCLLVSEWIRTRNINRTVSLLQYRIVYCYNGAQRYEQFLQVDRLRQASIVLGLAICLPSAPVSSSVFTAWYLFKIFCSLSFTELSLVGLALYFVDLPLSFSAVTLLVGSSDP